MPWFCDGLRNVVNILVIMTICLSGGAKYEERVCGFEPRVRALLMRTSHSGYQQEYDVWLELQCQILDYFRTYVPRVTSEKAN